MLQILLTFHCHVTLHHKMFNCCVCLREIGVDSFEALSHHVNNHKKAGQLPHRVPCLQRDCSTFYPDVWRFIRHFRKKHSEDVAATVPDDLNESYDDQDGGQGDITGR